MAEEIIGGYRLQNLMMTGQTSQVWEVVEVSSHRHFAMKLLLPENVASPEHRQMLFHEASVGKELAHPNIIRLITVNKDVKNPYFVMEFFPGGSLKFRLMRKQIDFIRQQAHSIFRQAATALAFMNTQGWVHRDVKPDNLLVNSAGDLRVIDFALARKAGGAGLLARLFGKKEKVMGTRSYMSPEQIRGEKLDGRADIYSFGATCYEICTSRPPFRASSAQELLTKQIAEKPVSPRHFNPDITEEFADLVLMMLAKKREDRPKDFHEILMKLKSIKVFKNVETKTNTES
ncbi:MAG: serine/threonine protein kinase [Gemmataceae bacterium]